LTPNAIHPKRRKPPNRLINQQRRRRQTMRIKANRIVFNFEIVSLERLRLATTLGAE
jgi:hypothetical protein